MNYIRLNLQMACEEVNGVPKKRDFLRWLYGMLSLFKKQVEITIRVVDEPEIYALNMMYRGKNQTTNVLSFPCNVFEEIKLPLLGDLVICRQIVERQAYQQEKLLESHWAHMVIHGSLHLLGYDHVKIKEAYNMESLEIKIMNELGYQNPYYLK
ncbi:metalloprotein, YbeY/UPF0054 family [secondary endosymbiont of Heteropsylla cubana]|uniref:Endoribonuclease YbeY n=1 Tax=secondary endosymbiont of Heteropsylla cubana TaxID=134287 RepID=J3VU67_9ENTR|nr:rRNA maturation RNase YbeY [secondary endosymbiont of Heteropsylla cubana]AFP85651.1 metalloprotein, YbeY/UPF0054 family [secondary endosymbiont of Heteropsylla cubana]